MVILPLTEEAEADIDHHIDDLLERAGRNLGRMVRLGNNLNIRQDVAEMIEEIRPQLPEGDAGKRMAKSYSMMMCLAAKVCFYF